MFVTTAYALSATAATEAAAPAEGETHNTETGVPHGAEEHGAFPPFDSTLFPSQILWLAITFGVFYVLVSRMVAPRISGIIQARETRIASDLAQAGRMKNEADAAVAKYEQELSEARAKSAAIAAEARETAKAEANAERARIEAEFAAKLAAAEVSIAGIKEKAMAEVSTVAQDVASDIVSHLTGVSIGRTDVEAAVRAAKG